MASSWRWLLAVVVLLVGAVAFACDGGDDNGDENGDQPTEEATVEDGDDATEEPTPEDGDDADGGGDSDEVFEDVPIPDGAELTDSGSWSGTIPFAVGADVDVETFTTVEFRVYEVDGSASDIIEFYRDNMGGWDEVMVFSGGLTDEEGGFGVWTRDDGNTAAWIAAAETDGVTELTVIVGWSD